MRHGDKRSLVTYRWSILDKQGRQREITVVDVPGSGPDNVTPKIIYRLSKGTVKNFRGKREHSAYPWEIWQPEYKGGHIGKDGTNSSIVRVVSDDGDDEFLLGNTSRHAFSEPAPQGCNSWTLEQSGKASATAVRDRKITRAKPALRQSQDGIGRYFQGLNHDPKDARTDALDGDYMADTDVDDIDEEENIPLQKRRKFQHDGLGSTTAAEAVTRSREQAALKGLQTPGGAKISQPADEAQVPRATTKRHTPELTNASASSQENTEALRELRTTRDKIRTDQDTIVVNTAKRAASHTPKHESSIRASISHSVHQSDERGPAVKPEKREKSYSQPIKAEEPEIIVLDDDNPHDTVTLRFIDSTGNTAEEASFEECGSAIDLFDVACEAGIADKDTRMLEVQIGTTQVARTRKDNQKSFEKKCLEPLHAVLRGLGVGEKVVVTLKEYTRK